MLGLVLKSHYQFPIYIQPSFLRQIAAIVYALRMFQSGSIIETLYMINAF